MRVIVCFYGGAGGLFGGTVPEQSFDIKYREKIATLSGDRALTCLLEQDPQLNETIFVVVFF
jgi:hypothetical protein